MEYIIWRDGEPTLGAIDSATIYTETDSAMSGWYMVQ